MKETLILYTSALCNLKCTYCYIDKNPILKDIDNTLPIESQVKEALKLLLR